MTAADRPSVTDDARAVREAAISLYRAMRRANPDAWAEVDEVEDWAYWDDIVRTAQVTLAAGRAETTTEEWPRCKASRDGGCDRCHDEHGRHIPCRAETTTVTDEDMFEQAWEVIVRVRDAHPRTVDDAPTEDIVDALIDARLLATARTRPTRDELAKVICESRCSPQRKSWLETADAVLALLADQPTEAEAGARALEQAAEAVYTDSVPSLAPWLLTRAARIRAGGA